MLKLVLCICVCALLSSETHGAETVVSYNAKVYDYAPAKDTTPRQIVLSNIRTVGQEIDKSGKYDIIVFPEYGIVGLDALTNENTTAFSIVIPEAMADTTLCRNQNVETVLSDLACILEGKTFNNVKYLVVNFLERVDNDIYNTNVVFAENGSIIAKYRKINLNENEKQKLKAGTEPVTFTTSFGVTFGLITSDDILHNTPAQDIFSELNVTDVIMTSAWQSEVPFFTAIGLQDGYAKKNGINFLVSSVSEPDNCRGGSGFYVPKQNNAVYVPNVPGIQPKSLQISVLSRRDPQAACNEMLQPRGIGGSLPNITSHKTKAMSNIEDYTFKPILKTENSNVFEDEICKGSVCCKFTINYNIDVFNIKPFYKVVVSGNACGLIACDNEEDLSTCGSRNEELGRATFNKVTIEAKFEGKEGYQYLPVSSNLELKNIKYKYCDHNSEIVLEATNTNGLVYLGVIGTTSSATNVILNFGLLGFAVIFMALFNRI